VVPVLAISVAASHQNEKRQAALNTMFQRIQKIDPAMKDLTPTEAVEPQFRASLRDLITTTAGEIGVCDAACLTDLTRDLHVAESTPCFEKMTGIASLLDDYTTFLPLWREFITIDIWKSFSEIRKFAGTCSVRRFVHTRTERFNQGRGSLGYVADDFDDTCRIERWMERDVRFECQDEKTEKLLAEVRTLKKRYKDLAPQQ
jgi:hypothetical protein